MRLKEMAPMLGRLRPAVPYLSADKVQASRDRDRIVVWRAWYKTARWQKLRWMVLVQAAFTCAKCAAVSEGAGLVADHVMPHRGNAALFWNRDNLQCLCKHCHDSIKQQV